MGLKIDSPVGLFGKPCRNVNSAVNCPGARDSMRSCSRLAGPSFPEFPPELFEFPEFGDGEFTLCRRLSITPLIDTNLFILLDDIFGGNFYFPKFVLAAQLRKKGFD